MTEMKKGGGRKNLIQFLKFGLVGISNTAVSYVIYALVIYFCGVEHYVAAGVLSFIISVLNAYAWQTVFVFREEKGRGRRVWWQVLLRTYAAYAFTGLILNNALLYLWIEVVDISLFAGPLLAFLGQAGLSGALDGLTSRELATYGAPILNMVVTIPLNFIINKFWAYRQKETREEQ